MFAESPSTSSNEGGVDNLQPVCTHYEYHAKLESCAVVNLELAFSNHLFSINRSQYCKLIPQYSTDDGCPGDMSDLSSGDPTVELRL